MLACRSIQLFKETTMYPYLLTLRTIFQARRRSPLKFDETGIIQLRAGIFDIDHYGEVNNGRQLTLMDLGRYDLGVRGGLMTLISNNKWGLAVGGSSIRYRRRIPFGKKYELRSRLAGHDGRWFYFQQEMWCGDKICSSALVKAGVISKQGLVPATDVIKKLPVSDWVGDLPDWIQAWIDAESQRPWPTGNKDTT